MMRINAALLGRMVRRAVCRRAPDIRTLTSKNWTLCPAEEALTPPAIHLPGEVDRIQGLSPWRERNSELGLIAGGKVSHAASQAHLLENVELVGAWLYKGAAAAKPGYGKREWLLRDALPVQRLAETHLVTVSTGSHFFGCLMLDDYPLALLPDAGAHCTLMLTQVYPHDLPYRQMLGLLHDVPVERARIDKLILYTDFAQNSLKARRYETLRAKLHTNVQRSTLPGAGVYLHRGRTGELRLLENEAQIERSLAKMGFDVIDPMALSVAEIARRTLDAPLVVAVEGSHLSHAIYSAAPDATFVVLQPPTRFAMAYKEYTDRVGMRFAFLVGEQAAGGFTVSPGHLQRLLDLVTTVRSRAAS
jgi:capsular polysaccharide biosynthesis protein